MEDESVKTKADMDHTRFSEHMSSVFGPPSYEDEHATLAPIEITRRPIERQPIPSNSGHAATQEPTLLARLVSFCVVQGTVAGMMMGALFTFLGLGVMSGDSTIFIICLFCAPIGALCGGLGGGPIGLVIGFISGLETCFFPTPQTDIARYRHIVTSQAMAVMVTAVLIALRSISIPEQVDTLAGKAVLVVLAVLSSVWMGRRIAGWYTNYGDKMAAAAALEAQLAASVGEEVEP
jgi:hypothetical protein